MKRIFLFGIVLALLLPVISYSLDITAIRNLTNNECNISALFHDVQSERANLDIELTEVEDYNNSDDSDERKSFEKNTFFHANSFQSHSYSGYPFSCKFRNRIQPVKYLPHFSRISLITLGTLRV